MYDKSKIIYANNVSATRMINISPEMTTCIKFMDENMQLCEGPLDHLHDQQNFLVVGCIGAQGVGKSTIMSLITSEYS